MKTHLRNYITSALLLLPAAVTLTALPSGAMAQQFAPEVRSLSVQADAGYAPGSLLRITLVGMPHVKANVRIQGVRENIALRETTPGVYVARYTLKRSDRVGPDTDVRAMLQFGKRTIVANYELGQAMGNLPPIGSTPPPPDTLRIERFAVAPIARIEPGAELEFSLEGMPGANASVDLPGIERDLRLRETRPGHYEGSYTIRRSDDLHPNRPVVASLRSGDRVVTANLNLHAGRPGGDGRPPRGDERPPAVVQISPPEGTTLPGGSPVMITATFEDGRGSGVDPATVRITLSGRNVTPNAQINDQSLSLRAYALPPGQHVVDITARDRAGNAVRKSWSFNVAGR